MWHPAHFEINLFEVADFNWRIVKNIEVFGAKSVRLSRYGWQARRDFPIVRGNNPQSGWLADRAVWIHQQSRVIPKGMIRIQFIRPHTQLVRIDAIESPPLTRAVRGYSPGVLVNFGPFERAAIHVGTEILDVSLE